MAKLSIIPEGDHESTLSILFDPRHTVSDINSLIYGGFLEHMGRRINGGMYDPENTNTTLVNDKGYRNDVVFCLRDELKVPVVRYPVAIFVASYRWQDGIGPKEKRPVRPELAWGGIESSTFGTDEFMDWCKVVGAEPYLCLNMGTGTLEDALAWLEYCNGHKPTYYANLRRQNGHDQPYKVKYWALGNEMWGSWQVEQHTKERYAEKVVHLILCGKDAYADWDRYVPQHCLRWVDMHSIHYYSMGSTHHKNISSVYGTERAFQVCSALIDLARCEFDMSPFPDNSRITTRPRNAARPTICFDEWNVWDPERAPGSSGAEERYTLSDALAVVATEGWKIPEGQDIEVYKGGGDGFDVDDVNDEGDEKIAIRESKWDGKGDYTFEKLSFTLLRWKL